MFRWFQPAPSYEQLIDIITAKNTAEAQKLIAEMGSIELSKIDNDGNRDCCFVTRS